MLAPEVLFRTTPESIKIAIYLEILPCQVAIFIESAKLYWLSKIWVEIRHSHRPCVFLVMEEEKAEETPIEHIQAKHRSPKRRMRLFAQHVNVQNFSSNKFAYPSKRP